MKFSDPVDLAGFVNFADFVHGVRGFMGIVPRRVIRDSPGGIHPGSTGNTRGRHVVN